MNSVARFHWTVNRSQRTIAPVKTLFMEIKEPVMSPRNVPESQQSVRAPQAVRSAAGCWTLAAGRALSLHPRQRSVLEVAHGRVWLTVTQRGPRGSGWHTTVGDQVLQAGERLTLEPGQHVVMEPWSPSGNASGVAFRWDVAPAAVAAPATAALRATPEWETGVVQPLRDLAQALVHGGRAVGTAAYDTAGATGRFAAGLARFALHRIAAPLARRPA